LLVPVRLAPLSDSFRFPIWPIPTSSNASPPNEFVIKKIEPPREKYLYKSARNVRPLSTNFGYGCGLRLCGDSGTSTSREFIFDGCHRSRTRRLRSRRDSRPNSAGKNGRTRYGIASANAFATSRLAHGNDALHGYFCSTVCAKRDRRRGTRRNLRQHPL